MLLLTELLRIAVIYKQVVLVKRLLEKENVKPGYKKYIASDTDIKSKKILKMLTKDSKSKLKSKSKSKSKNKEFKDML